MWGFSEARRVAVLFLISVVAAESIFAYEDDDGSESVDGSSGTGRPALVLLASPYTRTTNNSSGFGGALALTPQESVAAVFPITGEAEILFNFPYSRKDGNQTDLALSAAVLGRFTSEFFAGLRGGAMIGLQGSSVPVVFFAITSRTWITSFLLIGVDVGYSAAGFHFAHAGLGLQIF